jgi:hypothetical protein
MEKSSRLSLAVTVASKDTLYLVHCEVSVT